MTVGSLEFEDISAFIAGATLPQYQPSVSDGTSLFAGLEYGCNDFSLESSHQESTAPATSSYSSPHGSSSMLSTQSGSSEEVNSAPTKSSLLTHSSTQREEQLLDAAIAHEMQLQSSIQKPYETDPALIPRAFMRPNAVRASQACIACRKRKVRCVPVSGEVSPYQGKSAESISRCCGRCAKMGVECIWAEERRGKKRSERTISRE